MLFQFFPDQGFEIGTVVLIEEVRKDRGAVSVVRARKTGVEGSLGFAEEEGQVLEIIVDMRIGYFFHPSRGRFLPPVTGSVCVVAKLDGVVEFVGDGHAQGI